MGDINRMLNELEKEINNKMKEEIKKGAKEIYEIKENFKKVGFTEEEAFQLLLVLIISNGNNGGINK